MPLHPIRALDHVTEEYQDYLLTEFRAKDPDLRAALERALNTPLFLAQEPFYQAHRPFKEGLPWKTLPIDAKLAQLMTERAHQDRAYSHQSAAIVELLSPSPRPVVVTTGTGSGKTEAFLLPVIQNAFEDAVRFKNDGLTAILLYPMNALANDQKLRIEDYLAGAGMAGVVRVEQYDRGTSQAKRREMRANPPHILLTNYMMLEYLLVRPADREEIFANHPGPARTLSSLGNLGCLRPDPFLCIPFSVLLHSRGRTENNRWRTVGIFPWMKLWCILPRWRILGPPSIFNIRW